MNDVLHHCARKSNEELKLSFEAVAVEMFCSAWISSSQGETVFFSLSLLFARFKKCLIHSIYIGNVNYFSLDSERAKLSKLIRLWEDKNIFSSSTLNKMRNAHSAWDTYKEQLKEDYARAIQTK